MSPHPLDSIETEIDNYDTAEIKTNFMAEFLQNGFFYKEQKMNRE